MDTELGNCDMCKRTDVPVLRKYYRYYIECKCCSNGDHFEIIRYCNNCFPRPPLQVTFIPKDNALKTKDGVRF